MRRRVVGTVLASLVLVAVAVGWAISRRGAEVTADASVTLYSAGTFVRDTGTGRVALVDPSGRRHATGVECARFYAAGGRASCLSRDPMNPTGFRLSVLDEGLHSTKDFPINGVPTRTRISADGRMLGFTVFVTGDSYTSAKFSTRTGILNLQSGRLEATLEDFTVDGRKVPTDANFWGVSFAADDDTFYATMATGKHFYLVRGQVGARSLTIITDGVECPSLSPDGTRLVYKNRLPDLTWQLWVYELASGRRTQLAERGNVDDQGTWADDHTILYGKADPQDGQLDVWSTPADGSGAPHLVADQAESPAVVH